MTRDHQHNPDPNVNAAQIKDGGIKSRNSL
jgi:hypothetical protein